MKTRIITGSLIAIVFIGILCGTLIIHPLFFDIFILLLLVFGIYELWHCLYGKTCKDILIFSLIVSFVCFASLFFIESKYMAFGACLLALITAVIIEFIISMFFGRDLQVLRNFILILFYPVILFVCLFAINHIIVEEIKFTVILLIFTVSPFTDVFAYFGGTLIGGPKLCPAISPKKTVAGAIVGLLGGVLASGLVLLLALVPAFDFLNIAVFANKTAYIVNVLFMGVCGSVCTQLGDLIASFIKRQTGIKDFAKILPGHGGIMDRIDGLLINGFFLFAYAAVFQLIL